MTTSDATWLCSHAAVVQAAQVESVTRAAHDLVPGGGLATLELRVLLSELLGATSSLEPAGRGRTHGDAAGRLERGSGPRSVTLLGAGPEDGESDTAYWSTCPDLA